MRRTLLCCTGLATIFAAGCSTGVPASPAVDRPEASTDAGAGAVSEASIDTDASTVCTAMQVSFQNAVLPVFVARCATGTVCHGQVGSSSVENLFLGSSAGDGADGAAQVAMIYAGLVGVPAAEDPTMNLVTAGDLQNSYLWQKIGGDPNSDTAVAAGCQTVASGPNACSDCSVAFSTPCGAQMPVGAVLAPSDICAIANWIDGGAKSN